MTSFAASTCFACATTPTERMSTRIRCLVCSASTGVNVPGTMMPSVLLGFRPNFVRCTPRLGQFSMGSAPKWHAIRCAAANK